MDTKTPKRTAIPRICTLSNPCCLEIRYAIIVIAVLEAVVGIISFGLHSLIISTGRFLDTIGIQLHYEQHSGINDSEPKYYVVQLNEFLIACTVSLAFAVLHTILSAISIVVAPLHYAWNYIWACSLILRIITELVPFFIGTFFWIFLLPWTVIQFWFLWVILAFGIHVKMTKRPRASAITHVQVYPKEPKAEVQSISDSLDPYAIPPPHYSFTNS